MHNRFALKVRRRFVAVAAIMAGLFSAGCPALPSAIDPDQGVTVQSSERRDRVFLVGTSSGNILEATLTVTARLDNMFSSKDLPLVCTISGANQSIPLVCFRPQNPNGGWNYNYNFNWQKGLPARVRALSSVCQFPFEKGARFYVSQGAGGAYSHQMGTSDENAVDFAMPEGTTVCAARDGSVIALRADSKVGGSDDRYLYCGNYIVVKHDDGTYASYMHLRHNGLLVKLGQQVRAGMPIGFSGNTGHSTQPHLHFDVYWLENGDGRKSLPLRFQTQNGVVEAREGKAYSRDL